MVAVRIVTVGSVIVFVKIKFNKFFSKMEWNDVSDSYCCIIMYKEGGDITTFPKTELYESSLSRTKR